MGLFSRLLMNWGWGWGGRIQKGSLSKICLKYPTMMTLGLTRGALGSSLIIWGWHWHLKFYTSVTKELRVRKFRGIIPKSVEVTWKKLVRRFFTSPLPEEG